MAFFFIIFNIFINITLEEGKEGPENMNTVIEKLIERFNYLATDGPIELEVVENLQGQDGQRQYIQLYGHTDDEGSMIDLTRVVLAQDLVKQLDCHNEKVTNAVTDLLTLLCMSIETRVDHYSLIGEAIAHYETVKMKFEQTIEIIKKVRSTEETHVIECLNAFKKLYEWVTINKDIVSYDGGLSLVGQPDELHIKTFEFDTLVTECIETGASTLLVACVELPLAN